MDTTGLPTEAQAKAIEETAKFGQIAVTEGADLARFIGRILGTIPEDAVGLVLGDPLRLVRTVIAAQYDVLLDAILKRRNVSKTEPVSPSVAIPLLQAAYDENRPELQELWAELIATALDPARSKNLRLSFVSSLKQLDPLDALVLRWVNGKGGGAATVTVRNGIMREFDLSSDEVAVSFENLSKAGFLGKVTASESAMSAFGREFIRVVSD